nr:hypothetical protein [Paracoccus saliphilus]
MDGSLEQLMRLLSNRGLEWLRQKIMDLPDPCPVDHPGLGPLAMAAGCAPVLGGLRGRISPLEVIVLRRFRPLLLRQAAQRVVDGDRRPAILDLVVAGGLVARTDPVWQLACDTLAEDAEVPLELRLTLSDDPGLVSQAEALLTTPPSAWMFTPCHVRRVATLVAALYRHGAARPRLSSARQFSAIFDHLKALAVWAQAAGCTLSVARIAFCLRLVDPDHDIADLVADLIQVQRPDGSFPPRLGFSTCDQTFADGVEATLLVVMALHLATYRRWRGPTPVWLRPQPLHAATAEIAAALEASAGDTPLDLHMAASLTRATGRDWLLRLGPTPLPVDAAMMQCLARISFRDPSVARRLRAHLGLSSERNGTQDSVAAVEMVWLRGGPVCLKGPMPAPLMTLWQRAAAADDRVTFRAMARIALHHQSDLPPQAIRQMARRMASTALADCTAGINARKLLEHLDDLILLTQLLEGEDLVAVAA